MKKSFLFSLILTAISFAIAVWFILSAEGPVPINWNIHGEVDAYGSPNYLLVFPAILLFTTLLLFFLAKIDPKSDNIKKSGPILPIIMSLIAILMLGIQVIIVLATNGTDINMLNIFMSLLLGFMFLAMGYYTPKIKHNYMLGIRTPWTLHSEKVWDKTHQNSGDWIMLIGVAFLACMLLRTPWDILVPTVLTLIIFIGIMIYSYILFTQEKNAPKPEPKKTTTPKTTKKTTTTTTAKKKK
jgi:uncharacterized membrane protein